MKRLLTALIAITTSFTSTGIYAQAKVTSIIIDKGNRNAVMVETGQPEDITLQALTLRLKRSGLSEKPHNGITKYEGIVFPEISSEKINLYTKVENGTSKNTSFVYMSVTKENKDSENAEWDSVVTRNIITVLNTFVKEANRYSTDQVIIVKQKEIDRSDREYQQLLNDQKNLEEKKASIEQSIEDISKKISEKNVELEKMKGEMADLKSSQPE